MSSSDPALVPPLPTPPYSVGCVTAGVTTTVIVCPGSTFNVNVSVSPTKLIKPEKLGS
jgi:hypothetical protein